MSTSALIQKESSISSWLGGREQPANYANRVGLIEILVPPSRGFLRDSQPEPREHACATRARNNGTRTITSGREEEPRCPMSVNAEQRIGLTNRRRLLQLPSFFSSPLANCAIQRLITKRCNYLAARVHRCYLAPSFLRPCFRRLLAPPRALWIFDLLGNH